MTLQPRWCPTNPSCTCPNCVATMSDTWEGLVWTVSCSSSSSQVSPPSSPSWFVPKCSQFFGPCCIAIFSCRLCQRSSSPSLVPLVLQQHRSILAIHFSLRSVVISSVHVSAREPSLFTSFSAWFLAESSQEVWGPLSFQQRLTGCRWGTKHCKLPLNPPISERSHLEAQISNHPISCISQLLLSGVRRPTTHEAAVSHIPMAHKCKCIYICMYVCVSNLFPFYIVSQCNLFCTQD